VGRGSDLRGWRRTRVGHGEELVGRGAALRLSCAGRCIGLDEGILGLAVVALLEEVAGFGLEEGGGVDLKRVWRRGM
jgi:hypothetical protein